MRFCLLATILLAIGCAAKDDGATGDSGGGPPAFFLQDPTDSLCLSGEEFKRCSIDTLFYVVGKPGKYQIHKRTLDGKKEEEDDGNCIAKKIVQRW